MSAPLSIRKVESKSDRDAFIKFPWTVYKGNAYWVPPLVSMMRHKLDKKKNASWEYMEGDFFIAWRGDQPVGTNCAFINHRHNEYWNEHIGFFGLFEVMDDQEAASALLETAAEYVEAKGYHALRGPASFSTNGECGILIDGFDDPPVMLYPYNLPYYQRLIENTPGFGKVMDLYEYKFTLAGVEGTKTLEQIFRVTDKNKERRKIRVRTADAAHVKAEFNLLKGIYNKAWEKNWGFVPFSDKELDEMVHDIGQFFDPRMAFFAEVEGAPRAFLLGLPDMNQVLHHAYPRPGKPEVIALLQMLWHWKLRSKINRVRVMLLGIEEGYRNMGIDAALFIEAYKAAHTLGWKNADGGWVLETNEPMNGLARALHGQVYKTFRFYERALNPVTKS